jgi:DNA recombination protein RmuC
MDLVILLLLLLSLGVSAFMYLQMRNELAGNRHELHTTLNALRTDLTHSVGTLQTALASSLQLSQETIKDQLNYASSQVGKQTLTLERNLEQMRQTLETKLQDIRQDTNQQLDRMRLTVDEQLHKTLEERLQKSFFSVAQHLENVQRGLGEMKSLAQGVGDLKNVLTNVKTKGGLGEIQLENILSQIMTPQQYACNVETKKDSRNFVEFAIKLPGKEKDDDLWIPVDAKFPTEAYQRLLVATEEGDKDSVERLRRQLYASIRSFAKDIHTKYIDPPHTTDFAIMFVPTEGLYAEILRDAALFETLQRDFKVTVTGPSTFSAFVYSLQMGFRSLAIEKHSSEVWKTLGAVKAEFGKFADILEKTKKKLSEANNVLANAEVRSRAMGRALRAVETMPDEERKDFFLLPLTDDDIG